MPPPLGYVPPPVGRDPPLECARLTALMLSYALYVGRCPCVRKKMLFDDNKDDKMVYSVSPKV